MFSILSRRCPLLATSLSVLFCLLSMLISDSRFDLVWFRLSCDHGWIRSGSVNVRKQQQQQLERNLERTIRTGRSQGRADGPAASRSSLTKMRRPLSSVSRRVLIAVCASMGVRYSTIPQPLDRPDASRMTSARTTFWSF